MLKRTIARAIALAMILAAAVTGAYATTLTGNPAVIAPGAKCLDYLGFYPGQWHARATQHSWIFSLGRMHVVCARAHS